MDKFEKFVVEVSNSFKGTFLAFLVGEAVKDQREDCLSVLLLLAYCFAGDEKCNFSFLSRGESDIRMREICKLRPGAPQEFAAFAHYNQRQMLPPEHYLQPHIQTMEAD